MSETVEGAESGNWADDMVTVRLKREGAESLLPEGVGTGPAFAAVQREARSALRSALAAEDGDPLRDKLRGEVERLRKESSDPQLNEFAAQQAEADADRLSALLDEEGSDG